MVRSAARRLVALVALAAWIGGGIAPALDVHLDGALVCIESAGPGTATGPSRTTVSASSVPTGDTHCVLCHLQRTVRGADGPDGGFVQHLADLGTHADVVPTVVPSVVRSDAPSRAPPVQLS